MIPVENIQKAFDVKIATSPEMLCAQNLWRAIYAGRAPWNTEKLPSTETAGNLCSALSKTATLELEWDISGSPMADYLKIQLEPFMESVVDDNNLRFAIEQGLAGGELLFFPAVRDDRITISTYETEFYYPVRYDEFGRLVDVILKSQTTQGDYFYTLLSRYTFVSAEAGNRIEITHKCFKTKRNTMNMDTSLGVEASLSEVDEWANLSSDPIINVTRPWFTKYKNPKNNRIEKRSHSGYSIYGNAIQELKDKDEQAAWIRHEFKAFKAHKQASIDLFKRDANGNLLMSDEERETHIVYNDAPENVPIGYFAPPPRIEQHREYINELDRRIESACEVAYGTISDVSVQAKTATEVESTQVVTFSTVKDVQNAMEATLREVIEIAREMAYAYDLAPWGEYEFSITWGDGIPEDEDALQSRINLEFARLMQMAGSSLINPEYVTAFIMANSPYVSALTDKQIEDARKIMPGAFDGGDE